MDQQTIDFSELIPPRLKINNMPDGSSIELIRREELDPADMAKFQNMQNRIAELDKQMKKTGNEEAALHVLEKMNGVAGEAVQFLAPDANPEIIASLKMGQRVKILQWWTAVHQAEGGSGKE